MTRKNGYAILQFSLLILFSVLLILLILLLSSGVKDDTLLRYERQALETLDIGGRIVEVRELPQGPARRIYISSEGDQVLLMEEDTGLSRLRILVHLDAGGSYAAHRLVHIHNPLEGWYMGNGHMWNHGDDPFSPRPRDPQWAQRLRDIIREAGEYAL
ncbi:hypothetical protein [Salinispira pacifica]|uniref:Uncharacterized protein n=1 Tax=Salinispira pacifica TaxID=1307761 RepID=V5WEK3_9SPIO|nr:hypothetical protein [Salinispira pacifica]AHC14242.1 hypothetical protein L21SP2_0820 [Salinispira pacifica]